MKRKRRRKKVAKTIIITKIVFKIGNKVRWGKKSASSTYHKSLVETRVALKVLHDRGQERDTKNRRSVVIQPHRQEETKQHNAEKEQLRLASEMSLELGSDAEFKLGLAASSGDGETEEDEQRGMIKHVASDVVCCLLAAQNYLCHRVHSKVLRRKGGRRRRKGGRK